MIDLAKERELFEEWCEYVQGLSTYMIGNEYEHRHTELSWLSWIASANREGYKLVPENHECKWCGCTEIGGFEK